jgi:hypothetical protein
MTEEEEEEEENNVLVEEIESCKSFGYSLREDRILFNRMLNEYQKEEYSKAFNAKGEYNSTTESLFMALIYQQYKMISQLIYKLSNIK